MYTMISWLVLGKSKTFFLIHRKIKDKFHSIKGMFIFKHFSSAPDTFAEYQRLWIHKIKETWQTIRIAKSPSTPFRGVIKYSSHVIRFDLARLNLNTSGRFSLILSLLSDLLDSLKYIRDTKRTEPVVSWLPHYCIIISIYYMNNRQVNHFT